MDNNENKFDPQTGQPINNSGANFDPQTGQPLNNTQTVQPKKNNTGKIVAIVLVSVFAVIIIFVVAIFLIISLAVKSANHQLVCTAPEGSITISYNDSTITGYVAAGGITYDFDEQKSICEKMGTEEYMKEFDEWFRKNTSGTCTSVNK